MRRPPRIAMLIGSLAVLAAWIAIDSKTRTEPAGAPSAAPNAAVREPATGSAQAGVKPEIPARSALSKIVSDPFSPQSWIPSLKKTQAAPPPAPVAPPLPFRFAGQLQQDSGVQVLLAKGDEVFPVKEGETLEGQYKVESVTDTEVRLLHLASGVQQTMQFGPPLKEREAIARAGASGVQAVPAPVSGALGQPAPPPSKAAAADSAPKGPAQLRWEGPQSARAGNSFSVALRVTSGEQIRSAPMQLRFDPALLESVSVRPGKYFGAAANGNFGYRVNSDGSIYVGVSNQAGSPAADAELLVLTFKPIRSGAAAEISVASLNLQGAAGRAIAYSSVTPFKTTITP